MDGTYLQRIISLIESKNTRHAKKIMAMQAKMDDSFHAKAERFFENYAAFVESEQRSLDFGVDSYLHMVEDMIFEQMQFIKTGRYSCTSFTEANDRVYGNPQVMEYYMHGLMLSQFLWAHHYAILLHFESIISRYADGIQSYLEIGGGHGLYFNEAIAKIGTDRCQFDLVDISASSLRITRQFVCNEKARFQQCDIFDYNMRSDYDFITMGEVLEHVEKPLDLLVKIRRLMKNSGLLFITVPSNSPAIDHIFLFTSTDHIRDFIEQAGYRIVEERCIPAEDMSLQKAEKLKLPVIYSGLLQKNPDILD